MWRISRIGKPLMRFVRASIGNMCSDSRLSDPGFDFSILTDFRARLIAGQAEQQIFERLVSRLSARRMDQTTRDPTD
jgi:hypothetical protein